MYRNENIYVICYTIKAADANLTGGFSTSKHRKETNILKQLFLGMAYHWYMLYIYSQQHENCCFMKRINKTESANSKRTCVLFLKH